MILFHFAIGIESEEGYKLIGQYIVFTIPLVILSIIYISKDREVEHFLYGVAIYGFILLLTLIFVADIQNIQITLTRGTRAVAGVSAIQMSRLAGYVTIVSIAIIYAKKSKLTFFLCIILIALSLYCMIMSATRGPLISLFFVLASYFIIQARKTPRDLILTVLFIASIVVVYFITIEYDLFILKRFQRLYDYESFGRYTRMLLFIDMLKTSLVWTIGLGPDGFNYHTGMGYPHNYFIELFAEYGILGLISFLLLSISGFYYAFLIMWRTYLPEMSFVAPIWMFSFLNSMVSGNIVANGSVLITSYIMISVIYILNNKIPIKQLEVK